MSNTFGPQFFRGNREKLRTVVGEGLIVITANGVLQESGDSTFPFRQDGSFWYLTGIDDPDVLLVMNGFDEYLIVPSRDATMEAFDGKIDMTKLRKISGVSDILDEKTGWNWLKTRLKQIKKVATLGALPGRVESHGFYANPARVRLIRRLKAAKPGLNSTDIRLPLARLRSIKQPVEIAAIEAAIELTTTALNCVKKLLPKLTYEYELAAEIEYYFQKAGAESAWQPIVASGANACQLHYRMNHSRLKAGELVVVDVGARQNHYVADITRTWGMNGCSTARQNTLHGAVLATQQFAIAQLKPGVLLKDYQLSIENFLGEQLRILGLITTVNRDTVQRFCPHSISHFLGLDPHDAGDYQQPLAPGMVLTVEPGIYIPQESLGVRIEDDVLITATGCRVLSRRSQSGLC